MERENQKAMILAGQLGDATAQRSAGRDLPCGQDRSRAPDLAAAFELLPAHYSCVLGAAILSGLDRLIEAEPAPSSPDWLVPLTTSF